MKTITTSLILFALTSAAAVADCTMPNTPSMPAGDKANMDAMLAGKKAITDFQQSNASYMQCLSEEMEKLKGDLNSDDKATKAEAQSKYSELTDTYNSAVSAEEQLVNDFNQAVRTFKAANP